MFAWLDAPRQRMHNQKSICDLAQSAGKTLNNNGNFLVAGWLAGWLPLYCWLNLKHCKFAQGEQ